MVWTNAPQPGLWTNTINGTNYYSNDVACIFFRGQIVQPASGHLFVLVPAYSGFSPLVNRTNYSPTLIASNATLELYEIAPLTGSSDIVSLDLGYTAEDYWPTATADAEYMRMEGQSAKAIAGLKGCTNLAQLYVSYNQLRSLDVGGMVALTNIESYANTLLTNVNIVGCSNLLRVCFENNAIQGQIDTTGCDGLRDFRAALNWRWNANAFTNVVFTPQSAANIYHLCLRDEPQLDPHWLEKNATNFPSLKELIFWNTGQTGAVNLNCTTNLTFVELDKDPQLVAVQFTNCPNLHYLTVSNCCLSSNAMEQVLASLWVNSSNKLMNPGDSDNGSTVALNGNGFTTPLGYCYFTNIQAVIYPSSSKAIIDWPPLGDGQMGANNTDVTFVTFARAGATPTVNMRVQFAQGQSSAATWHWADTTNTTSGVNTSHQFGAASRDIYHTNYVTVDDPGVVSLFGKAENASDQGIVAVHNLSNFSSLWELYLYKDSLKDLSLANCSSNLIQLHLATNPGITNCDQWFADVKANSPQTNSYGSALSITRQERQRGRARMTR